MTSRIEGFATGLQLAFDGTVCDWLESHAKLPHSARSVDFDRGMARFLNDILDACGDLNTRQIQLTASNMANIDTPGYRAVGMDFEAEMRQAMRSINDGDVLHDPKVKPLDGLIVRPDGNNVSMDRESLNLAESQLRFKTGVALLKGQFSGIMSAIHADAK